MKYLNRITSIYLYIIILVFPLVIGINGYNDILEVKWNFYVYISAIYMLILLITTLVLIINHNISINDFNFKIYHILAIIYLIVLILSNVLSQYKDYNLLIGSPRMEGLLVNIIYIVSFIFISLTYKFNKRFLDIFIIPCIIIGIIIILQYMGLNIFYLYKLGESNIFYGTIGNIDMVGMLYIIYIIFIISRYIFNNINILYFLISMIISSIVMYIINVEATYFTLFIILLFLLPIITLNSKYLKKYLDVLIIIISSSLICTYNYYLYILLLLVLLVLIRVLIGKKIYHYFNKKNIIIGYIFLLIVIVLAFIVIYLFKFNVGILNDIHNIMHFNLDDKMGNYRMFLWKRTVKMIDTNILFGSGCDTFYIKFMKLYLSDLKSLGSVTINDTACNIYLTMFINNGILGLLLYLSFMISILKKKIHIIMIPILLSIISYLIYGMFSFNVVIVTPIFYTLLSIYTKYIKSI